jgi:crotonobetainyl-CoA:carnitine CoA-transferase CaiB-like acyl-CoA transferase
VHNSPAPEGKSPLAGIRVLDLSRVVAGPWAGQIFGDLGADVIKVERPGVGDDTRAWGPPFLADGDGQETREATYFMGVNRMKRSITVDLKSPAGQEIVRRLAGSSDVLLENFKVGTLARLGLGYADLHEHSPGLIYCSITGFGQDGPRAGQSAYDFAIQALGGLMSVTGEREGPQKVGVPIVDLATGLYATVAILAALHRRSASGLGDHIDIAMLDVQVSLLANQAMTYLVSGNVPHRTGNAHPHIQPQNVYLCQDGDLAVAVGNDTQFVAFCAVIGEPGLADDERFRRNRDRVRHRAELESIIVARLAGDSKHTWADRFVRAGVPAAPINTIDEVFDDPQVRHRGMRLDLPHPLVDAAPAVASPLRFGSAPLDVRRASPLLGQHTDEILRGIGYSEPEIAAFRETATI